VTQLLLPKQAEGLHFGTEVPNMIVQKLFVTFPRQWATTRMDSLYIGSNILLVAARCYSDATCLITMG
jgi:hypothetical protein